MAGESSIKTILRSLQSSLSTMEKNVGKFQNLADIGITTDPKTGQLNFNESKTKQALQEDYDSVAGVFVESDFNQGLGARMATTLKQLKDPMSGPIRSKMKSLDAIIKNQDQDIERRERMLEQKQENIRRKFTSLDNKIAGLKSQGDFLAARLGGGGGGGGAPGGGGAGG